MTRPEPTTPAITRAQEAIVSDKITATVKLRRDWIAPVKPEAEIVDGMRHQFTFGWELEEGMTTIYVGEIAWEPEPEGWPTGAPTWIASGDLVDIMEPDHE